MHQVTNLVIDTRPKNDLGLVSKNEQCVINK